MGGRFRRRLETRPVYLTSRAASAIQQAVSIGSEPTTAEAVTRPDRGGIVVTLVRPSANYFEYDFMAPATPPIGLAYVAAAIAAHGYDARVIDGLGEAPQRFTYFKDLGIKRNGIADEEIIARIAPETRAIGVTCMFSYDWPFVRNLIEAIRPCFPDVPIVVGGEHATAMPGFVLTDCPAVDVVVRGEGEETICELLDALISGDDLSDVAGLTYRKGGEIVSTAARRRIRAIDKIPRPRWDLVPIDNYLDQGLGFGVSRGRHMPIIATRGCPYQCTFCSNPAMWTTAWKPREPDAVLDEVEDYLARYRATNIDFYDLTLIVDPRWLKRFARGITERGLTFTWQLPSGTRSEAIDAEVAALLYQTGCRNLNLAPESGSPRMLRIIKKKVSLPRLLATTRQCLDAGLNVKVNFIVGFPQERLWDLVQTGWLAIRMAAMGVHDSAVAIFSPYPGSEIFEDLYGKDHSRLDDEFFLSLGAYSDMSKMGTAWSRLNPYVVTTSRFLIFIAFYGVSFLVRPGRVVRLVRELFSPQQTSRGATVLRRMFNRKRAPRTYAPSPKLRLLPAADCARVAPSGN
ncbi:MAG: radical SAM protein [Candidatus Rokuibacteriota bacterium]|nr:MAG: radical SAM protein [Candidatus Rokubacteria bacterium]